MFVIIFSNCILDFVKFFSVEYIILNISPFLLTNDNSSTKISQMAAHVLFSFKIYPNIWIVIVNILGFTFMLVCLNLFFV